MIDLSANKVITGETVLGGDYQSKNLQAVFAASKMLNSLFEIPEEILIRGVRNVVINTGLQGRWQILSTTPLIICDTGHNKEGLEYVLAQVHHIRKSGLHIVIGFVNDKDLDSVLPLFPTDAVYYFTKASVPRALNEKELRSKAGKYGLKGESFTDVKSALDSAQKNASFSDLIFIGGSTFVVAEVV